MKIKNLKYIFGVVFGLCFLVCNISFSQCTPGMAGGTSQNPLPGNGQHTGQCRSYASDVGDAWYNNKIPVSEGGKLFLKMAGLSWIECNSSNVKTIQTKMQSFGVECSTCIDGKAGHHTRDTMASGLCHEKMCPLPNKPPRLQGENLICDDGYETGDVNGVICCKLIPYEPQIPIINTNPQREGGVAHVVIQYTDDANAVDHWDSNADVFHVSVGTIDNLHVNESNMSVTFDVKDIGDDVRSLDVSVGEGLIIFQGNISSLGGSNTFTYEINCPNPPDLTDPENPTCPQQGYVLGAGGCCEEQQPCTGNQYQSEGGGCQDCTGDTVASADHTKCICDSSKKCCGIQLNTVVPFIGDCIEMNTDSSRGDTTSVTSVTAFPILMQGLMKILMSAIMVFSFLMVIVAGLSMTTGGFGGSGFAKGKTILKNVIISLILLGCSGLILSLVNPSFFGG